MRFINSGKLYDTDKSKLICKIEREWYVRKQYNSGYVNLITYIYKTKKESFYMIAYTDDDKWLFETLNKTAIKTMLEENNAVEPYEKLFGKLQEA